MQPRQVVMRIGSGNLVLYTSSSGVLQERRGYILCPRATLPRSWVDAILLDYSLPVTELVLTITLSTQSNVRLIMGGSVELDQHLLCMVFHQALH